ncbi:hypothetical protein [Comamonas odontotermitis]|uniref:hypothetical protein n=1 Tax=Comamonas odontotermitis TaxID=379895 RepID=UPI003752C249
MGFVLAKTETFQCDVKTQERTPNGSWREESFSLICKRTGEDDRERRLQLKHGDLLREVVTGWKGIKDENGAEVPFNEQNFEGFLQIIGAVAAAVDRYWLDCMGVKDIRSKN